jgi:hypothetical protein
MAHLSQVMDILESRPKRVSGSDESEYEGETRFQQTIMQQDLCRIDSWTSRFQQADFVNENDWRGEGKGSRR